MSYSRQKQEQPQRQGFIPWEGRRCLVGLAMGSNAAIDRLRRELHGMIARMRGDLDRIEILIAALNGFSRPVPDYEPRFRHHPHFSLNAHELGRRAGGKQ